MATQEEFEFFSNPTVTPENFDWLWEAIRRDPAFKGGAADSEHAQDFFCKKEARFIGAGRVEACSDGFRLMVHGNISTDI
ncbi:hypothetical protein [Denitromonas halophila]|uniref:Uncharacterized protein n=1 Tax=Denitromonas halophila TaxID=1629404 RepID=A0A557QJT0_9RHOO|nr:hypothetical protein [Denitromonas halophila]TVO53172.1 hypothetical protein FHP91_15345 [Denitromonas halophila]